MSSLRTLLLSSTSLNNPEVFRVVVDGVLLTPRQRVEREINRQMARLEAAKAGLIWEPRE